MSYRYKINAIIEGPGMWVEIKVLYHDVDYLALDVGAMNNVWTLKIHIQ